MMRLPLLFNVGINVKVKRMIPSPPIHCVSARQSNIPLLQLSTSRITVAPVVVNPDIASKNASLASNGVSHKMNGNIPNKEKTIHATDASKSPSRRRSIWLRGCDSQFMAQPVIAVIAITMTKAHASSSRLARLTANGNTMNAVSTKSNCPSTLQSIRKLMAFPTYRWVWCRMMGYLNSFCVSFRAP